MNVINQRSQEKAAAVQSAVNFFLTFTGSS